MIYTIDNFVPNNKLDKIKNFLNYSPKRSIENAVQDLCEAFKKNLLKDSFDKDIYFNINRMKNIKAK